MKVRLIHDRVSRLLHSSLLAQHFSSILKPDAKLSGTSHAHLHIFSPFLQLNLLFCFVIIPLCCVTRRVRRALCSCVCKAIDNQTKFILDVTQSSSFLCSIARFIPGVMLARREVSPNSASNTSHEAQCLN